MRAPGSAGYLEGAPGRRWSVPGVIELIWRLRERFLERFPRLSRFLTQHGIKLIIVFFFLLYAMIALLKHMNFKSHAWDLGIFDQAIYQYSRFEIGYNTVRLVPCLLADHWHPSLFLFAPFYWIWSDVRMLLIVQAAICAVGVLPVYCIAREKLRAESTALACAFIYLFYWGMMELAFFDFHPHVLYPPLIALAYYFIVKDRMGGYFLCLPFLLIIQEQVALTVAFLGLYLVIFRRRWFEGFATLFVSLGWYYAVVQKIIPALNVSGAYYYFQYYQYLGDNLLSAARYLLTHPWIALKLLFWPYHKIVLLFGLLAPFLFLPLGSGFSMIILPDLLQRLYSSIFPHWEMSRHYNAVYAPVFIIATLEVLPRLYRRMRRRYPGYSFDFRKLAFALCVVLALLQFPFTFSRSAANLLVPSFYYRDARDRAGYEALSAIPKDASVCAQDMAVPHLSHRERIYLYDGDTHGAEYVIVNRFYDFYPFRYREELDEAIAGLRRDPGYEVTDYGEGWLLFHIKPEYDVDGP